MQLMPNTAARAATEVDMDFDPREVTRPDVNVKLGAHYIAKLLETFGGNVPVAVAAYNAGPHAVQTWLTAPKEREVDLWVARIPYGETRAYVRRVLGNLSRYQYLAGGVGAVSPLPLQLPEASALGADAY
jgi:soluble lytic murein transglycosylase